MRMGAAPVPQHVKRNTRKRRRKKSIRKGRKKRRRRRNESISLPSRMRVQTRTDNDLTRSTFSSHKSDTVAKDQRMWNREGLGEPPREQGIWCHTCEFSPAFQQRCDPRRVSCTFPGASSGQRLISGRRALFSVSSTDPYSL